MSDQSYLDQAKQAASDAGNKLTNSVKNVNGVNPVKKIFKDFLTGRVCVVTGGGRGIGKAIAEKYAAEGFTIILTARSRDQLKETAASCKAKGAPACDTHGVDLSHMSQVRTFTADVLAKHKSVDVLVNNAGMGARSGAGPIEGDSSEWEMAVDLNLKAPMLLTQAFAAGMVKNQAGLIINIGSIAGEAGKAEESVYAATKWGLRGWSLSNFEALRKDNVKVVLIHPGPVATSMTKGRFDPELALEADDVAEAALLPLRTTALCVPKQMTLDTAQIVS
ncbi:hypothetical protein ABBQ38_004702 [Trebouxia sp. C0009 RCD-2024]